MEQELREKDLRLSELLGASLEIISQNLRSLLPVFIILAFTGIAQAIITFRHEKQISLSSGAASIVLSLLMVIAYLALFVMVESYTKNEPLAFGSAVRKAFSSLISVLWAAILSTLIIFGMLLLLVVPGIIYAVYYIFAQNAVVLRGMKGKAALDYSKSLVKGRWWRVFWYFTVLIIMTCLPSILYGVAYSFMTKTLAHEMAKAAMTSMLGVYYGITMTIFFINLDFRRAVPNPAEMQPSTSAEAGKQEPAQG